VGVLSDHIFAILDPLRPIIGGDPTCPPGGGAPSTLFTWVQQTKSL